MSCYYNVQIKNLKGDIVQIPCGKCIGCRLEKARQWAVRCVHEAQMHEENCFITLTYNNENLPKDRCINKKDLQLFFKRLRKKINKDNQKPYQHQKYKEIRYYACGEYGDRFSRPHYHACIFGHDFHDKEKLRGNNIKWKKNYFSKAKTDFALYRSAQLESCWTLGFSSVGEMSFESAGYVARYVMKKITGDQADIHYKRDILESGSDTIEPEFALMSRMPGLGQTWLEKYYTDVYPKDYFHINGVKNKPPRYYDDQLLKKDSQLYDKIKKRRIDALKPIDILRLKDKEKHKHLTVKQLQRSLHNG